MLLQPGAESCFPEFELSTKQSHDAKRPRHHRHLQPSRVKEGCAAAGTQWTVGMRWRWQQPNCRLDLQAIHPHQSQPPGILTHIKKLYAGQSLRDQTISVTALSAVHSSHTYF
eukprot:5892544-Amphidinium_carterae.1